MTGGLPTVSREEAIRRFFLEPLETYTLGGLALLWQDLFDDIEAMFFDEICASSADAEEVIVSWAEAMGAAIAFSVFRPVEIERALGVEFARVLPDDWRIQPLLPALPLWLVTAIENEPSIPSTLDLAGRVEQLLILAMRGRSGQTCR